MTACNAAGPEELRCDRAPHFSGVDHRVDLPHGVRVRWEDGWDREPRVPFAASVIWPAPLAEGLAALGAVLREVGAALCFDCGGRGYYLDCEACACNRGPR